MSSAKLSHRERREQRLANRPFDPAEAVEGWRRTARQARENLAEYAAAGIPAEAYTYAATLADRLDAAVDVLEDHLAAGDPIYSKETTR